MRVLDQAGRQHAQAQAGLKSVLGIQRWKKIGHRHGATTALVAGEVQHLVASLMGLAWPGQRCSGGKPRIHRAAGLHPRFLADFDATRSSRRRACPAGDLGCRRPKADQPIPEHASEFFVADLSQDPDEVVLPRLAKHKPVARGALLDTFGKVGVT